MPHGDAYEIILVPLFPCHVGNGNANIIRLVFKAVKVVKDKL